MNDYTTEELALADKIINELDGLARDYDNREYGLPVSDDVENTKMRIAVCRLIREAGLLPKWNQSDNDE